MSDGKIVYTMTQEAADFLWSLKRPDVPATHRALGEDQVWVLDEESVGTGVPYKIRRRSRDTYVPLRRALTQWLPK